MSIRGAPRGDPKLLRELINPAQSAPACPDPPVLAVFSAKRNAAAARPLCGLVSAPGFFVVQRDGVELQPVIDQAIAELAGDLGLQSLDFLRLEFDHLAGPQIDQ